MRTFVVTGGTDGIGKAVALAYLAQGDEVAIIGRNAEKGAAFLTAADRLGASARAHFVLADLSLVSETRAAIDELRTRLTKIDALVLGARHYRSARLVTAEGFEHNLALFYLSRFVLSYGLVDLLDAAEAPIILNVAGPGSAGKIHWDDLGLAQGYDGMAALMQGGPLNDLLGIGFAQNRPSPKVRYVLFHPGVVSTSFSGQYDQETAAQIEALRATAKPVEDAIQPILALLDNPPAEPISASMMGEPLSLDGPSFDAESARRLYTLTEKLLAGKENIVMRGVSAVKLRELLDSRVFATIATIQSDGRPQQSVVWVKRDGDNVLFMIAAGSGKAKNLRRDPRVSVLVSPHDAPYTYAAIHGTATMVTEGTDELRDELSLKYIGKNYADHIRATPEADAGDQEIVTVRVTPHKIVGRL